MLKEINIFGVYFSPFVGELLIALRQMTKAHSDVPGIDDLYRTLSEDGNPALSSLAAILKAMGLRLSVRPLKDAA